MLSSHWICLIRCRLGQVLFTKKKSEKILLLTDSQRCKISTFTLTKFGAKMTGKVAEKEMKNNPESKFSFNQLFG